MVVNLSLFHTDTNTQTDTQTDTRTRLRTHTDTLTHTGGPRYIREIGTQKIGLHITNLHIKRPRVTVNQRIGSRKEAISGSHILEIADKKTAYNEGCLYIHAFHLLFFSHNFSDNFVSRCRYVKLEARK